MDNQNFENQSHNQVDNQNLDNQPNTKTKQSHSSGAVDRNLLYIGIFTVAIIVVVVAVLALKPSSESTNTTVTNNANANNAATPDVTKLSIINEDGNQNATLNKSIKFRKIEFSKTIEDIKAFEAKQKDTLDNPSEASSQDGYTYLSYKFNTENPATFFGTQVAAADASSMLTYVFKDDALIEVRIQYGAVGSTAYDTIVAANNATYGEATYSRIYNNGTKQSWWKTKKVTLDIIFQDQSIVAYYRTNNK